MERKDREIFPKRTGPFDLDSRSDFCFVAQSFQKNRGIGPLLRCADAGMAREVIVLGRKGWKRRGAVGGTSCVPYRHIHNPHEAISYLRDNGMSIVAVVKNDRSTSLFDCAYPLRPAFVLGDETYGVCQSLLDTADLVVDIPMYGTVQSLDISISGAIVMYDYLQKKSRELQLEAGKQMNQKCLNAPPESNWRVDFCFVAQSFQKEHNIDAVLRCANAGKATEVVAVGRRDWYERGAMNDTYGVSYRHIRHPNDAIDYLRDSGRSIVVIEKNERSTILFDCVYPPRPALVLGNEVYGVYPAFLDAADLVVEIPMYGVLRSLNVSVAGAVVMYDYLQKRSAIVKQLHTP